MIQTEREIFLCEYHDEPDRHRLYAVLDELTLTYRVIERVSDGPPRALRRHIPSLRDARAWADEFRDRQTTARHGRPA
jgi:hypothetical protein